MRQEKSGPSGTGRGWFTGGATFYSTSGVLAPPNPYLIPAWYTTPDPVTGKLPSFSVQGKPYTGEYTGPSGITFDANYTDSGLNRNLCFNLSIDMGYRGQESLERCLWRIYNGLTCLDVENQHNCTTRLFWIQDHIHSVWNYRQRPYQDVARDPVPLVVKDQTWWTSDPNLNGFLAMPHVPWFSNCDGYDSYMVSRGRARARALGRARD
jgi:hypothetical protein